MNIIMDTKFDDEEIAEIGEAIIDAIAEHAFPQDKNGFTLGKFHMVIYWVPPGVEE